MSSSRDLEHQVYYAEQDADDGCEAILKFVSVVTRAALFSICSGIPVAVIGGFLGWAIGANVAVYVGPCAHRDPDKTNDACATSSPYGQQAALYTSLVSGGLTMFSAFRYAYRAGYDRDAEPINPCRGFYFSCGQHQG